jgi:hypothetical protein
MAELTRRWRPGLVRVLLACTSLDVVLTSLQAAVFNGPAADGPIDWIFIVVAITGPALATALFALLSREA